MKNKMILKLDKNRGNIKKIECAIEKIELEDLPPNDSPKWITTLCDNLLKKTGSGTKWKLSITTDSDIVLEAEGQIWLFTGTNAKELRDTIPYIGEIIEKTKADMIAKLEKI